MPCVPLQSLTAFFKFFLMLERCSGTRYIADPRPAGWTEQTISFPSTGSPGWSSVGSGPHLCLFHHASFWRMKQSASPDLSSSPHFLSRGHCLIQIPFSSLTNICSLQGPGAENRWMLQDDLNKLSFTCPSLLPFFPLFFLFKWVPPLLQNG